MSGRLEGKVAFITGAARGQGREHVLRMAQEGAAVVAVDIQNPADPSTDFAQTVAAATNRGYRILARECDVRNGDELTRAAQEGFDLFGRIDTLVANAAVLAQPHPLLEASMDTFRRTMDVNVYGVWHSCRAVIPFILEGARGGSIIITNSVLGLKAVLMAFEYTVSKHALVGMMKAMAVELAPHSIRVNSIHPTTVDTPMLQSLRPAELTARQHATTLLSFNALPVPWVEAADVSSAAIFLASDESRYITGATLPVDAGALLK
jgi:SDR family mycofactocin-dependent oxidoreductase